jgi:hypothetical protein
MFVLVSARGIMMWHVNLMKVMSLTDPLSLGVCDTYPDYVKNITQHGIDWCWVFQLKYL